MFKFDSITDTNICRMNAKGIWHYYSKRHSLTECDIAEVMRQLLGAVAYLHANNIVHTTIQVCFIIPFNESSLVLISLEFG